MNPAKQADFFLGADTPNGFFSFFSELNDPALTAHCYILKGCPGSGKSTLLKQTAAAMADKETLIERIHCSSDPDSLDGVILHGSKTAVADGTPPHTIEPKLPVAYETVVSLYDCFDPPKVAEKREEALALCEKLRDHHRRCCCYLAGAELLLQDNYRIAAEYTDRQKIVRQAKRLAQKELPDKKSGNGIERRRMLSAVTPKGNVVFTETVSALCDRVYLIKDEYSAAGRVLLQTLKEEALRRGYELFCCYCPLGGIDKPEHLLIPELGLGFVTQNSYITYPGEPYRVIHFSRFTDKEKLKLKKQRIGFNKRAAREMLQEAVASAALAKALHDELEEIYGRGVDFDKVSRLGDKMLTDIAGHY